MSRYLLRYSCLLSAGCLAFGGCVTSTQLQGFARTETARVIADVLGQFVAVFVQAASPFAVQ